MKTIDEAISDYWAEHPDQMNEITDAVGRGEARAFGSDHECIVVRVRVKDGIPYMVVWLGISVRQDGLIINTPLVKKMARDVGARWAEFYTKRRGFIRIARTLGFERLPDEDGFMKFKIPV